MTRPDVPRPNPLAGACVVLVRTQGPVNLGLAARLCGNLGIADLRLVAPECAVDCAEARMFSTHSKEQLLAAPVFPDLPAAIADCGLVIGSTARHRHGERGAGLRPHEVPALLERRPAERWALVFGNEADGLSDGELNHCQAWLHLDTFGANHAYNLATAVAIACYQIATAGPQPASETAPAAPRAQVDALGDYWLDTLDRFQYFRRTPRAAYEPLFRRFLNRQHLAPYDVQTLRGMLAQMSWHAFGKRFDGDQDAG